MAPRRARLSERLAGALLVLLGSAQFLPTFVLTNLPDVQPLSPSSSFMMLLLISFTASEVVAGFLLAAGALAVWPVAAVLAAAGGIMVIVGLWSGLWPAFQLSLLGLHGVVIGVLTYTRPPIVRPLWVAAVPGHRLLPAGGWSRPGRRVPDRMPSQGPSPAAGGPGRCGRGPTAAVLRRRSLGGHARHDARLLRGSRPRTRPRAVPAVLHPRERRALGASAPRAERPGDRRHHRPPEEVEDHVYRGRLPQGPADG
jgi:hypothetical protein